MKEVRDRRDARWLPSRFHFALFRLYAYLRLRAAKPEPVRGLIMAVDRHQSASENFLTAIGITFVGGTYFAALFERSMSLPLAYAAGLPAAVLAIQAVITASGLIAAALRGEGSSQAAANTIGIGLMAVMIAAGGVIAAGNSSARYVARGFLVIVAMNAAAAMAMFLLRREVAAEERRLGVER